MVHKKSNGQDEQFKFELANVNISKFYKKFKKKYVLAIYHEQVKYIFGFELEITCKRVHKVIADLLDEKRKCCVTKFDNKKYL